MNPKTQIVFIHQGYSWYLPYALYQAKTVNPDSEVILLSDKQRFPQIATQLLSALESEEIFAFRKDYAPMSSNSSSFELFCWLRWFHLLNYMRQNEVESVVHLDSDVLIFSSIAEIKEAYSPLTWECALSIPYVATNDFVWSVSGHVSYWNIERLEQFCSFILSSFQTEKYLNLYKKKWEWHQSQKKPGGICDMTTLYFFWEMNSDKIINLAKGYHRNVFDHNVNVSSNYQANEYIMENKIKRIKFMDNYPYLCRSDQSESLERVHTIHFQGSAKQYMRKYYNGNSFPEKNLAVLNFYGTSFLLPLKILIRLLVKRLISQD